MPIEINGSTGISGVDGSASTPALQGSDSNTGVSFGTDTVNINTGGSTRATIESNGRLGIGTTSPACDLHVSAANPRARFTSTGNTVNYDIFMGSTTATVGTSSNHDTVFMTNDSERIRIHDTGEIQISSEKLCIGTSVTTGGVSNGMLVLEFNGSTKNGIKSRANPGASESQHLVFIQNSSEVGRIHTSNSSTSYATSSDYRLKENVTAISDGITRLKTLKPSRFNFKVDPDKTVDGFLAHEVTAVPEAISGTKDEVDSDNNPKYQTIDQSKLVPLLTAALQEAVAKIEVLETKVAGLEAG
jgi:hypothetical protein|tara:strand:- start:990 stop:1895 length:906 start_codon:yes stop_codon:yes gene_type:complete